MTGPVRFLNRRDAVAALTGGLAAAAFPATAASRRLAPTPRLTAGPFYPRAMPADDDTNLLRVKGRDATAEGLPLRLSGRVLDVNGRPLKGARVEIWQCDNRGIYHHSFDRGDMDPNFQGFGRTATGESGHYRFLTIRPVPYGGRTPHIHFKVKAPGRPPLITQMFLADEAERNDRDWIYRHAGDAAARAAVTVELRLPRPRGVQAEFDIVLE